MVRPSELDLAGSIGGQLGLLSLICSIWLARFGVGLMIQNSGSDQRNGHRVMGALHLVQEVIAGDVPETRKQAFRKLRGAKVFKGDCHHLKSLAGPRFGDNSRTELLFLI